MSCPVREKGVERAATQPGRVAPSVQWGRDLGNFRFQTVHLSLSAATGLCYGLTVHYLTFL